VLVDGSVVCFVDETREVVAAGEVAGAGEGLLDLNQECLAGVGETAAGDWDVAAVVAAAASFFLECLCVATLGDASGLAAGDGDWASNEVAENAINVISRPINLFIPQLYWRSQWRCNAKMARAGDSLLSTKSL
jgi:hypothetical protein